MVGKKVKSYAGTLDEDRVGAVAAVRDSELELDEAMDASDIARLMRPRVASKLAERIAADEVSSGDLVKLLGMLNDRIDGKVADKVEHSGVMGIAQILASIDGKTAGLPKLEDRMEAIDVVGEVVYDAGGVVARKSDGDEGGDII